MNQKEVLKRLDEMSNKRSRLMEKFKAAVDAGKREEALKILNKFNAGMDESAELVSIGLDNVKNHFLTKG